jgi:NUMOD4 motif/HNH endonuclease/NUMOD1 domain
MRTEEYKDIRGYEGLYQVSNLGNIKSLAKSYKDANGNYKTVSEYVLFRRRNKSGYLTVVLWKDDTRREFLVHKLVASAFLERVEGLYEINHIDGNITNNDVSNLEWCDKKPQNDKRPRFDSTIEAIKKFVCFDCPMKVVLKRGNDVIVFSSIERAAQLLNIDKETINFSIRKQRKLGGWEVFGYKYANEEVTADE